VQPALPTAEVLAQAIALTGLGERLGPVVDLHPRGTTEVPEWVWVRTGITDADVHLVPLAGARYHEGGLVVAVSSTQVERSPGHPAGTDLTAAQRDELARHYALRVAETRPAATGERSAVAPEVTPAAPDIEDRRTPGSGVPTASPAADAPVRPAPVRPAPVRPAPGAEPRPEAAPQPRPTGAGGGTGIAAWARPVVRAAVALLRRR